MADIINQLPDKIANQIAAGEVIQRPASAVKELLENAIDANATEIKLILKEAGKLLIQVIDNGSGMSPTDARMCFERHATSKILKAEDLFEIRTMGFRGEALASIAAIAQVELKTRQVYEDVGTFIQIEGFELIKQAPCQTPIGTSLAIKNLFYNIPARRNFLKSNQVELRHIIDEFQRIALAHPAIHFWLFNSETELFNLPSTNLKQRVVSLFGNNYKDKLVPVKEETTICNIYGFIGTPDSAKKARGEQFFFVNNRFIKSSYLNHAVMQNFYQLLPKDSYPLYILFIDLDPKKIDVNVHPTKQEIKFDDEKIVYSFIHSAVKRALAQHSITPSLDFDQNTTFSNLEGFTRPFSIDSATKFKAIDTNSHNFRPASTDLDYKPIQPMAWQPLYEINKTIESNAPLSSSNENELPFLEIEDSFDRVFQLQDSFMITTLKNGLLIIDQQSAHERILFEKYETQLTQQQAVAQKQLFPQNIELGVKEAQTLAEILGNLNLLGFDIQEFGKNSFVIHALPSGLMANNLQQTLEQLILNYLEENSSGFNIHQRIALSMAKQTCIKKGMHLSKPEMKLLIDELFHCKTPFITPNGKKVFFKLDDEEIRSKLF
jgi:DNA mismatch repair protein MutL